MLGVFCYGKKYFYNKYFEEFFYVPFNDTKEKKKKIFLEKVQIFYLELFYLLNVNCSFNRILKIIIIIFFIPQRDILMLKYKIFRSLETNFRY